MAGKMVDFSSLILVIAAIASATLILLLGTNSTFAYDVGTAVSVLALLVPAYWALDVRHALAVRLYRNQAFGIALLSVFGGLSTLPLGCTGCSSFFIAVSPADLLGPIFAVGAFLGLLYLVDATVLAGRRSDPLLRDTFHWSKVRLVFWAWEIFNGSSILLVVAYSAITGDNSTWNSGIYVVLISLISQFLWIVPISLTVIMLVPVAIRAKDQTLRRHFRWLAMLSIVVLVAVFSGSIVPQWVDSLIFSMGFAFVLYRSVRALVPLNRISLSATAQ